MKHLFTFLFILFAGNMYAQPTVNATDFNPLPGETFVYHYQASPFPIQGAGGANMVWDYHTLQPGTTDTLNIDLCSNTPECNYFTGSNIASGTASEGYAYYNTSSGSDVLNGAYGFSDTITYSGDTLLRYPFTYSSSFSNNYTAIDHTPVGITSYDTGSQTVTCDGYGTLILPSDTVQNVLRIHTHQVETDSTNGTFHVTYDKYYWIAPGYHNFLMTVEYFTTAETQITDTAASYSVQTAFPTSVSNIGNEQPTLQLYPNPAKEALHISFSLPRAQTVSINLFDIAGRQVANIAGGVYQAGAHQISCNTSSLQAGIYLVNMRGDTENITQKIEIQ